jgi:tetratricopeptide (TPR) repeat protein
LSRSIPSLTSRFIVLAGILLGGCRSAELALYYEGETQLRKAEYSEAYRTFTHYLAVYPGNADGYYNRGIAAAGLNMVSEADSDFSRAILLDPDDPDAHWMRYKIRMIIRDAVADPAPTRPFEGPVKEARSFALTVLMLEDLTAVLTIDPDNLTARGERGALLATLGRYEDAKQDLNSVLSREPWDVWTRNERGRLWHAMGLYEKAVDDYDIALSYCDTCTWLLYNKALSLKAGGETVRAIEALRLLVTLDDRDGESWFMIGECELQLGHQTRACEALTLSLHLGVEEARRLVDSLCH